MFTEASVSKGKDCPSIMQEEQDFLELSTLSSMVQWSHGPWRASLCATHNDKSLSFTRRSQYYNLHGLLRFPKCSRWKRISPFPVVPWELIGQASGGGGGQERALRSYSPLNFCARSRFFQTCPVVQFTQRFYFANQCLPNCISTL